MKFFKHEFELFNGIELINDEIVEQTEKKVMYFAFTNKSNQIFEEEYGQSVIEAMANTNAKGELAMLDSKLTKALAVASYKDVFNKLDDYTSAQMFKESEVYKMCSNDTAFIEKLFNMVTECVLGSEEQQKELEKKTKKAKKGKAEKK